MDSLGFVYTRSPRFCEGARSVIALDKVELEIRSGEFMVVMCPLDMVKTTMLRIIAGLEELTDCEV